MSAGITIRGHPSPDPPLPGHRFALAVLLGSRPPCRCGAQGVDDHVALGCGGDAGARPPHRPGPLRGGAGARLDAPTSPTGAPPSRCSTRGSRSPTASRAPSATRSTPARSGWPAARSRPTRSDADGHFALAAAVGRASLSMGKKERIRRARIIRDEALRTIALDPRHDGAYHILGRWNAEIMRLSGLSRFFAKSCWAPASSARRAWEGAVSNMERAVALDPEPPVPPPGAGRDLRRPEALRRRAGPAQPSWRRCPTARSWTASTGARPVSLGEADREEEATSAACVTGRSAARSRRRSEPRRAPDRARAARPARSRSAGLLPQPLEPAAQPAAGPVAPLGSEQQRDARAEHRAEHARRRRTAGALARLPRRPPASDPGPARSQPCAPPWPPSSADSLQPTPHPGRRQPS